MSTYEKYILDKNSFKYILIWFLTLASIKFFTLFITDSIGKMIILLGTGVIVFFFFLSIAYDNGKDFKKAFTIPLMLIFISLFSSTIAAEYFHEQGIKSTMMAQYDFYYFSFYFLLHKLKPHPDRLIKMFIALGIAFCVIYFAQWLIYPKIILASKVFEDRGTVRIFMPGGGYLFSAYFLFLSGFFIYKKGKYLIWLLPMLAIFFLLGTRQVLASIALLTILNVLLSKTIKSKVLVYMLIVVCIIPVYFLFEGIFSQMMEVTTDQSDNFGENIRFRAASYFLMEFNNNPIWMLVGNGMPDYHSAYGRNINGLIETFGYYQSDIGIIGDFTKFGILFVIGQITILVKLIRSKLDEKNKFILYNTLSIVMTMFTGSGLHASTIALICMMMYISDVNMVSNQNIRKQVHLD